MYNSPIIIMQLYKLYLDNIRAYSLTSYTPVTEKYAIYQCIYMYMYIYNLYIYVCVCVCVCA